MIRSPEIPDLTSTSEHQLATKRLNELMNEYLHIKKIELENIFDSLPSNVRKRAYALKKLQLDTINLDAEFHREVYALEQKMQSKHDEIFKKRREIISGDHEPTEEEWKLPDVELNFDELAQTPEENPNPKGIPNFWLTVLKNVNDLKPLIQAWDEEILKHLIDVRAFSKSSPELMFQIEFHFAPNEFFKNSVLTKTYLMKCRPDPEDPYSFDGPEIYASIGSEILWNDGKDVTTMIENPSSLPFFVSKSFFNFFKPPAMKAGETEECSQIETYLESDFEIGHYLKERVIPRAVLFFTGEIDETEIDDVEDEADTLDVVGDN